MTPSAPAPTEEIVTRTPRTAPVVTVSNVVCSRFDCHQPSASEREKLAAEKQRKRGKQQQHAEHTCDDARSYGARQIELRHDQERQRGCWHATHGEQHHDAPSHSVIEAMHQGTNGLRRRRVQQISPDSGGGVDAE